MASFGLSGIQDTAKENEKEILSFGLSGTQGTAKEKTLDAH